MVSMVQNVAIDCADAYELARFWSKVTGCPLHPDSRPGDRETQVMLPTGPVLYFQQVPEPKSGKNRLHLWRSLRPPSLTPTWADDGVSRTSTRRSRLPRAPHAFAGRHPRVRVQHTRGREAP